MRMKSKALTCMIPLLLNMQANVLERAVFENQTTRQKNLPNPKSLSTFSHAPAGIQTQVVV